jgi:glycosyltransferase involved in cell wall biosynthesis
MNETNTASSPKVSIIVPVYNTEKFLERCLASVCGQILKEIEIICINDGSTDSSLEILREYAARDSRITIINQKNEGPANARNKGLQVAAAPYIGFVDSDDFIAPDMYEKMYNAIITNDVDFVECGAEPIFTYTPNNEDGLRHYFSNENLNGIVREPDIFINTSNEIWRNLFKKELITKYHLVFSEDLKISDDSLFVKSYKSIVQSGFYIQEKLYIYFCYENSIMGKTYNKKQEKQITELFIKVKMFYSFLKSNDIFEQRKYFFWDFFVNNVNYFYEWASPEIIKSYGIGMVRDLFEIEDICKLAKEKNKTFLDFTKTETNESAKSYSLTNRNIFRKICKCILPYGLVRLIQKKRAN